MAADLAAAELLAAQVQARKMEEDRDESWIRLSSSGACSRQIGYRITNSPAIPDSLADLVVFEIGHAIHQRVQSWLVDLGWARPELLEVPLLWPSARVRGTADAITERLTKEGYPRSTGTRRVVEIKSIGNQPGEVMGKQAAGAFDRLTEPKDHHIDQATAYAWVWNTVMEDRQRQLDRLPFSLHNRQDALLGNSRLRGMTWPEDRVTHLTFVYVAKDGRDQDMPIRVFTQKVSEKRTSRLVEKLGRIWSALDRGELPSRDHDPWSRYSPCQWCPYRDLCIEELLVDGADCLYERPERSGRGEFGAEEMEAEAGTSCPDWSEPDEQPVFEE